VPPAVALRCDAYGGTTPVNTVALTPIRYDPDASKFEQIVPLQESLLLGTTTAAQLPGRLCQSTALLVDAVATRLVALHTEGGLEALASYRRGDFDGMSVETRRGAVRNGRPALSDHRDGHALVGLPPDVGAAIVLQVLRAVSAFSAEQIALARYAAALTEAAPCWAGSCV
jgi:hypothetical protein